MYLRYLALFVLTGIEEDFIAWKSKLLEFLTGCGGTEELKSCACGRTVAITTSSCSRQLQRGNPADVEDPSTVGEQTEVSILRVPHIQECKQTVTIFVLARKLSYNPSEISKCTFHHYKFFPDCM